MRFTSKKRMTQKPFRPHTTGKTPKTQDQAFKPPSNDAQQDYTPLTARTLFSIFRKERRERLTSSLLSPQQLLVSS